MNVNEAFARIKRASKNVVDVVVLNKNNHIIWSSSADMAKQMSSVIQAVDKFKENDELTFLKIRTKKCEYLVVPDKEYMLVAILNPADESLA